MFLQNAKIDVPTRCKRGYLEYFQNSLKAGYGAEENLRGLDVL